MFRRKWFHSNLWCRRRLILKYKLLSIKYWGDEIFLGLQQYSIIQICLHNLCLVNIPFCWRTQVEVHVCLELLWRSKWASNWMSGRRWNSIVSYLPLERPLFDLQKRDYIVDGVYRKLFMHKPLPSFTQKWNCINKHNWRML